MRLIIASNNAHKVREIMEILGGHFSSIQTLKDAGIDIEAEEDGKTFQENALKKARAVLEAAPGFDAALADDSGLCVDALGGAPGVYSARYAGVGHDDGANNQKLLKAMRGEENRACHFVCAVALVSRDQTLCVQGECQGQLLEAPCGESGFGYDPLFYYVALKKSFAQMSAEEKNAISHRFHALQKIKETLENAK